MDASKTLKTSSTDRSQALSLLRIAACIAILVLHTVFAANEYFQSSITGVQNMVSRVVENNMMWAVPVFLMVTGALQLDPSRKLTLRKLYGKYIRRILLTLVLFSVVFRLFDMVMDGEGLSLTGLLQAFTELVTSKGWGHLWYLYLLIGLYVLLPFYRKITETCTDRELTYLAAVYVVFTSFIPMIESAGLAIGFYISESLVYPLYLLAGHMLYVRRWRIGRTAAAALVVLTTAALAILTAAGTAGVLTVPKALFGYASPLVILQAVGVFALAVGSGETDNETAEKGTAVSNKAGSPAWISRLDQATFGIYLVHMAFIRLLFRYAGFDPYTFLAPVTISACVAGFFCVSYAVTRLLKQIPGIRTIL